MEPTNSNSLRQSPTIVVQPELIEKLQEDYHQKTREDSYQKIREEAYQKLRENSVVDYMNDVLEEEELVINDYSNNEDNLFSENELSFGTLHSENIFDHNSLDLWSTAISPDLI